MINFSLDDLTATHYFLSHFEDLNAALFTDEAKKLRRHLEAMIENLDNTEQFAKYFAKFSSSQHLKTFQAKLTPINALKLKAKKLGREIESKKSTLGTPETVAKFRQGFRTALSSQESELSPLLLLKKQSSDLATKEAALNTAKPIIISREAPENHYQISGTPGNIYHAHLHNGSLPGEKIGIAANAASLERNRVSENARVMLASTLENVRRGGICQFRMTAGKKVELTPIQNIREKLLVTLGLLADHYYDLANGSPNLEGLTQALSTLNHPLLSVNDEAQLNRFLQDVINNVANQSRIETSYQITVLDANELLQISQQTSLMQTLTAIKALVIAQMLLQNQLNVDASSEKNNKRSHEEDEDSPENNKKQRVQP